MVKKITKSLLVLALAALTVFGVAACGGTSVATGTAKSYALVHGQGYMGSVTAVVDSNNKVHYVQINEYFLPSAWAKATLTGTQKLDISEEYIDITPADTDAELPASAKFKTGKSAEFITENKESAVVNNAGNATSGAKFSTSVGVITIGNPALKNNTEDEFEVTLTTTHWAKYIKIADKYFEATFSGAKLVTVGGVDCYTANPVYKEIGVTGGITNLDTYLKPSGATFESTLNKSASKWYGEAVEKGEVWILQVSTNTNAVTVKDAENTDVKLYYDAKAVGASGGINKRFSSYGNAGYSWMKSILKIEEYIYASGFDYTINTNSEATAISGATADDTMDYMLLAKSACEMAKGNA